MCMEPTTAALVITAVTSAMSINAQQQQASYQEKANQMQYDAAIKARDANINQTNLEMVQERENAMQKLEQNHLKADAAMATATTSAGESGISGLSVGSLLDDLAMNKNRYDTAVTTNYDRSTVAIENQRQNANINAANVIAGMRTPTMPDYATAGLRIGNAYMDYSKAHQ
jgi:hypothetical protein